MRNDGAYGFLEQNRKKDYFIASSTATATATVAPTMGLLPMLRKPWGLSKIVQNKQKCLLSHHWVGAALHQPDPMVYNTLKQRISPNIDLTPICPQCVRDWEGRFPTRWV